MLRVPGERSDPLEKAKKAIGGRYDEQVAGEGESRLETAVTGAAGYVEVVEVFPSVHDV
jgi:hypothetical protein